MGSRSKLQFITAYCFLAILLFPVNLFAETAKLPAEEAETVISENIDAFIVTEQARDRELSGEEDPLAQRQAELLDRPDEAAAEPNELKLYGSLRLRYRDTGQGAVWGDGGSRAGLNGRWQFKPGHWLFGRGEAGFNLLDNDLLFNRSDLPAGHKFGEDVFMRLLFVGIETPGYNVTAGKNWSTYYRVTSFTDRFQGTGASASGTFNAGTDGGYTGTGRADRVVQTRVMLKAFDNTAVFRPLTLNLQVQNGEPIPTIDNINYQTTIGVSSVFDTTLGFAVGLAYNHATIDEADISALSASGIDGDATALALGLRWYGEDWYFGTVASRLNNHETTDKKIYFDGNGWEVYGQYRLFRKWWAVAGWNSLEPDSTEAQAGDFNINYGIIGVRYSFREFSQMIFANARIESSNATDGAQLANVYTIGVRWDLP